jgi:hypothetical protein
VTQGGKAQPVYVVEPSELRENGGTFRLEGGPAVRVYGMDSAALDDTDRGAMGGPATAIYVISDELATQRGVQGGTGMVVTNATQTTRGVTGLVAMPVWVSNGDDWPSPIQFIGSTTDATNGAATSLALTVPSGTQAQDLMIAEVSYGGGAGATVTEPAGWTVISENFVTGQGWLGVYYRLANSSEPATYTWNFSASAQAAGGISTYRCVNQDDPIHAVSATNSGNSNSPKGNGVTTSVDGTRILWLVASDGVTTMTPPDGYINENDISSSGGSDVSAGKGGKGKGKGGSTGDQTGALSTSTTWQTIMVAVSPCDQTLIPPAAPNTLTATATGTTIDLTWVDVATNETGYKIERSLDNVTFAQIGTAAADATTYSDSGLTALTLYYYRVRAYNADGDSAYSNTASDTTGTAGRSVDPGTMEYWDIGNTEMPPMGPNNIDSGTMEYWDVDNTEMPPVWTVI